MMVPFPPRGNVGKEDLRFQGPPCAAPQSCSSAPCSMAVGAREREAGAIPGCG